MLDKMISIIVPVYNAGIFLEKCITSIINQTYTNLQIILVNDGSTDNSLETCKKFQSEDSRIEIIDINNSGVSKARNVGLSISKGDYIGFVDSDDFIDKSMYERLISVAETTNSDIVECGYCEVVNNEVLLPGIIIENRELLDTQNILKEYLKQGIITNFNCNKLYNSRILSKVKYRNLKYSEDFLFNIEAIMESSRYASIPDILYFYVKHTESATNRVFGVNKFDQLIAGFEAKDIIEDNYRLLSKFVSYYIIEKGIDMINQIDILSDKTSKIYTYKLVEVLKKEYDQVRKEYKVDNGVWKYVKVLHYIYNSTSAKVLYGRLIKIRITLSRIKRYILK